MKKIGRILTAVTVAASTILAASQGAFANEQKLKIAGGVGILFAPIHIMKQAKLVEKHSKEAGADIKLEMINFPSGSAVTDALLSGNVDIVAAGVSNLLLLWSRTREDVKAIAAVSGTKSVLVTKDAEVQKLEDFDDKNRISVTSLKISNQAIYLQMALDEKFGDSKRLDPMMVQLGFTDSVQAMMNPKGPIDSTFIGPPYYQTLLKQPGMHAVLSTVDIAGSATNLMAFTTKKYHDSNPQAMKVFMAALAEAQDIINKEPQRAAEIYLQSTGEKFAPQEIAEMFKEEGNVFQSLPSGVHKTGAFMAKVGMIHRAPESWKDFFFTDLHNAEGANAAN